MQRRVGRCGGRHRKHDAVVDTSRLAVADEHGPVLQEDAQQRDIVGCRSGRGAREQQSQGERARDRTTAHEVSSVVCSGLRVKDIAIEALRADGAGGIVQNLLMNGAFPVDGAITKIYFAPDVPQKTSRQTCASIFAAPFACARTCNA